MKQIEAFEHCSGWGSVKGTTEDVNDFISQLSKRGIRDVDIEVTATSRGCMFSVIYETKQ